MSGKDEWVQGQAVNEKERREQKTEEKAGEEGRSRDGDGVAGVKRDR